ncbi:response regulator [Pseudomonas solani]|uniref:response regulator n=1 Tax=Pseudomonas solani TaxID=2731552 RepID=UPI003C2EEF9F
MSRILVVEEQTVTRHALRLLLEAAGHEVVAEADNGVQALQLVRQLQPALMIMELNIPRLGGLELIQRLRARDDEVKVLVLTAQRSEYFAARCLEAGAQGFVSKHEDMAELGKALDAVLHGHGYFPSHVLGTTQVPQGDRHALALKALSARELAVLQGVCKGLSNVAIGEQLALSDKTVSTYKIRLKQKLQASSQLELIDIARRHGLAEGDASPDKPAADEQRLLRRMIDALPYAVNVRDLEGRLLTCNAAYLAQRQVTLEAIQGKRVDQTTEMQGEDPHLMHEALLKAIRAGVAFSRDVVITVAGQPHVLRHWGQPYHDSAGQSLGMIFGNVDITDRDVQLRILRQDAEQAHNALHDHHQQQARFTTALAAPLQRLAASLEQVESAAADTLSELLAAARADSRQLLKLLAMLQQANTLNLGKQEWRATPVDLRQLLSELIEDRRSALPLQDIALDLHAVRHPHVLSDAALLRQVMATLLSYVMQAPASVRVCLAANGRGQGLVEVNYEVQGGSTTAPPAEVELDLMLAKTLITQMSGEFAITQQTDETHLTLRLLLTQA